MTDNDPTSDTADADLRDLANEIASTSGVSLSTALMLAQLQRPALRRFVGRWNARIRRARAAHHPVKPPDAEEPSGGEE